MAIPEGTNPKEFLQDVFRKSANKEVARFFNDLGENWEPSIADGRSQLRWACTHQEIDTTEITNLRHALLYDILGYSRHGLAVFYGASDSQEVPATGHPKISLYFSQDAGSVAHGKKRLDAEYSFRLVQETQSTITPAKAKTLATELKSLFVSAKEGIILTKGKSQYLYFHKEKGYRLRIYGNTEPDAVDIIKKLLQLTNTAYDQDRLTLAVPKRSNTSTPGTHIVYGESAKLPQFRPIANVRFRYAYMKIPGKPTPVFLVDTTYRYGGLVGI